jgi:hypothetical protein
MKRWLTWYFLFDDPILIVDLGREKRSTAFRVLYFQNDKRFYATCTNINFIYAYNKNTAFPEAISWNSNMHSSNVHKSLTPNFTQIWKQMRKAEI